LSEPYKPTKNGLLGAWS